MSIKNDDNNDEEEVLVSSGINEMLKYQLKQESLVHCKSELEVKNK